MLASVLIGIAAMFNNMICTIDIPEPIPGYATAYCVSGTMASGQQTRIGVCAGKREWIGKTAVLFQRLPDGSIGDWISTYDILDTGGTDGLKEGKVIDVWRPDMDGVQEFMDIVYEDGCQGRVYIFIIDKEESICQK